MSNSSGSTIEWESDYYPFGTPNVLNGGLENYFRFADYEWDPEMSYYYVQAREQSPNLGRFFSPDTPLADQQPEDPQSWNLYSYVRNNPVSNSDPTGKTCQVNQSDGTVYDDLDGNGCADVDIQNVLNPAATNVSDTDDDVSYQLANGVANLTSNSSISQVGVNGMLWADGIRSLPSLLRGGVSTFKTWQASGNLVKLGLEGAAEAANAAEAKAIVAKAAATVGNQGIKATSRAVAEQAADEWVGADAKPLLNRTTGAQVGLRSADGTRIVRFTSVNKPQPYINLVNQDTGANLHVSF